MLDGGLQSDTAPQGKVENVSLFESEMPDQGGDIVRHQLEAQWALDVGGVPVPLQLDADDAARRGKLRHNLSHCLNGHEATGKQYQRLPAPAYLIVEVQAVDRVIAFLLVLVCGHVFSPSFVTSMSFAMCKWVPCTLLKAVSKSGKQGSEEAPIQMEPLAVWLSFQSSMSARS